MADYPVTDKTKITRLPKRGSYDKDVIHAILDEALVCTLAFVRDGEPFQIPTGFCRVNDYVYVHGSVGSFYMRELAEKKSSVCISVPKKLLINRNCTAYLKFSPIKYSRAGGTMCESQPKENGKPPWY
jgi:hypothetical protein